ASPLIVDSGDNLAAWLLIWSLFLPMGAVASVDSRTVSRNVGGDRAPAPREVTSIASAALIVQLIFVYVDAFFVKVDPQWRRDLSAIYYFVNGTFATPTGRALGHWPEVTRLLTVLSLMMEAIAAPLILMPWGTRYVRTVLPV